MISLIIHNNNIFNLEKYEEKIRFFNIQDTLKLLSEKEFDVIYIKDNLTLNCLDFYGLVLAYQIRLTEELKEKRYIPIVIISDLDGFTISKLTEYSKILFTKNIFLNQLPKILPKFDNSNFNEDFLNKIEVKRNKDNSTNHDISNEWSIYKWAEFLRCESEAININKSEIEDKLYFKYIKAKFLKNTNSLEIIKPTKKGNVLLIDDQWNKGWSDILKNALQKDGLEFYTFEYDFKDKSNFNLIVQLNHKELKKQVEKSDVVILDLRLLESDYENEDINNYTGIKILQKIHEINSGIQVIMLTATSKSIILEKLYEKKILGYIKKEHPEDKSIDTVENINKLINLVDKGLKRKYLKEVFNIQKLIKDILSNDIFAQYNLDLNFYEPFWIKLEKESTNIFDILDNERENSFIYAMISISSSLETILSIFINEQNMTFWDGESYDCQYNALRCRILKLFEKLGSNEDSDMKKLIDKRNDYLHSRKNITVNQQEIVSWFTKLLKMIQIIKNSKI